MPDPIQCPECGAVLTPGQPQTLCPRCALKGALEISNDDTELVPPSPTVPEAGERIGRYKLLEKIGEGGCGIVYMAEQEEPVRRRVALKVIKLGMDTREVIARFEAERQALALMDHPHIARIFDGGATDTGRPYFVMELVRGLRITDYCDQKNLSTRQRLDLFMQVCQAVQHAHQKGIIHRDLKPSNILVTVNDGMPVPKVIDFGIAKATGQQLTDKTHFTKFHQFLGSPAYTSPEQAEMTSLDIDTRSDIYSIGVLLYELLTGRLPFDARELLAVGFEEMLRTIRECEPVRPSARLITLTAIEQTTVARQRQTDAPRLVNLLRGDLDWIVMKCLEKERARRYESASGLAMDIKRHLDQDPVLARPTGVAYRLQKFVRRNKGMVAAAATIVLTLALGLAVSSWQWYEAVLAKRGEAQQRGVAEGMARAEAKARAAEGRERQRAEQAMNQVHIQRADERLANQQALTALGGLARVLRDDPSNQVAAELLLSVLTYRSLPLPACETFQHTGAVNFAQFSPDGERVVTASSDRTARIWDTGTGQALTEPLQHDGRVTSAQFSPDGQWIVTTCTAVLDRSVPLPGRTGGYARVWDARTGKPLTEPLKHRLEVHSAQFSPDGQRVLTAGFDVARVWDARTGQALTEVLRPNSSVQFAQFSPDGRCVLTAASASAQVWDARTGQALTEPLKHSEKRYGGPWYTAQFSPDGQWVVTASYERIPRVWDTRNSKMVVSMSGHDDTITSAQFSPDGQKIVTASHDKTARIWDAHTGQAIGEPLRHDAIVISAKFSPDGQRIVTASYDHTARLWDARTGKPLSEPLQHQGPVNSAQFSADGIRLATASQDGTAQVWDMRIGQAITERLPHSGPTPMEWSARFSPDGQRIVTSCLIARLGASYARVWAARTGQPLTVQLKHGFVRFAEFSADGKWILTCSIDPGGLGNHTAQVWNAHTGRAVIQPIEHETGVQSGQLSPDGRRFVTGTFDGVRTWDAQTGQALLPLLKQTGWVNSVQFSPDGQHLLTASDDRTARIWDATTGQPLTEPLRHNGAVVSAQFSSNGLRVVTASSDQTARVWDATTGQPLTEPLEHNGRVTCASFSPDGRWLLTACGSAGEHEGYARIWDAITGEALTEPFKHNGNVNSAQFSANGARVVTAAADQTARVWDARTGQALTEPLRHHGRVASAQFSPDGQRILTAANNGVRLWDVSTASLPIPDWLPDVAEVVAGQRLNRKRILESVRRTEFPNLKRKLADTSGSDDYSRWVRWFFADRSARTISPLSTITVPEYVQHRINENTLESLHEAIRLSPANGLAFARLAVQTLREPDSDNPRRVGEADFFSRRAVELSPSDPEVQRIRGEIVKQIKTPPKP